MQKDKQERYLELLAGLRLMDDDFFSEALDEKCSGGIYSEPASGAGSPLFEGNGRRPYTDVQSV